MAAARNGILTEEQVKELDSDLRQEFKNRIEERIEEIKAITPLSAVKMNALVVGVYTGRAGILASILAAMYANFKSTSNFHSSFVASDLAYAYNCLIRSEFRDETYRFCMNSINFNNSASELLWKKAWKWVGVAALSAAGFVASVYVAEKCAKKIAQHCSLTKDGLTQEQQLQNLNAGLEIVKKSIESEKN